MLGVGGDVPPELTEPELQVAAAELRAVLHDRDLLSLRAARLAGLLSRSDYGDRMGSVSTADWIRHECNLGFQAAADLVTVGEAMDRLPSAVEAVERQEIGFQHLVLVARTQAVVGDRRLDVEHLLAEAREVSVGRFWHVCQQARHAADAQAVADEQAGAVERRELRLRRQEDGMVTVTGVLDAVGGAAVKAALEPLGKKAGRDDDRNRDRRLADALVELSTHAMDQASPKQRPHLNVTATLGTLYLVPGSASAEVDHGSPVSQATVGRLACDCSITRHIFDSDSVLVEMGREKRVVSAPQRKALERRDGHCRWPGCTRSAAWCEAHHVVPWMQGGPTNLANLVLLCTRHHWQVHEGRWKLFLEEEGTIRVLRPPLDFAAPPRAPAA